MWFKRELVHISVFLIFFGICVESKAVEKLKVLSFNAALLDASIAEYDRSIPNNREERLEKLIEYLNNRSNADVVCLQEVHFGQNVEKIVNQVRTKFPYSFSGLHLADGTLPPQSAAAWEPSCAPADFYAFITCAIKNKCISATTATTVDASGYQCLLYGCYKEFENLVSSSGEKCLGCLITNTPSNFVSRCANSTSTTLWNMNKIGLLMLSNRNLTDTSAVEFFPGVPNILVKGYLRAKVADILNMACAHAVPTAFDFPPLNPQFSDFSEQNAAELQMLVDAFSGVDPSCLIGDFNVGPGSESLNPMEECGGDGGDDENDEENYDYDDDDDDDDDDCDDYDCAREYDDNNNDNFGGGGCCEDNDDYDNDGDRNNYDDDDNDDAADDGDDSDNESEDDENHDDQILIMMRTTITTVLLLLTNKQRLSNKL